MKKILLPVDGSESATRAVAFAIEQVAAFKGAAPEIHLLNVQLPIHSGFASQDQIERFQRGEADRALADAKRLLGQHGVNYIEHVAVGQIGETIAHYAATQHVEQIIMGSRGLGTIGGLVLGSAAAKVIHLAHCPVTLVK